LGIKKKLSKVYPMKEVAVRVLTLKEDKNAPVKQETKPEEKPAAEEPKMKNNS
jgi:hypothetical protein